MYEFLYMFRLKESAETFFEIMRFAKRADIERLELKNERELILKKFFKEFDERIVCKEKIENTNGKRFTRFVRDVTTAFVNRLQKTKSVLEVFTFQSLPGMVTLYPSQRVKLLFYKEFLDQSVYFLLGLDDENEQKMQSDLP